MPLDQSIMSVRRAIPTTDGVVDLEYESSSDDSELEETGGDGGHGSPNWSLMKSCFVLLSCTVLYSMIAEVLISSVDKVVNEGVVNEKVLGITLFSLVPTVTEFYNAIHGNIALSLEIGSAYVMQVAMLQIPAMVFFSRIPDISKFTMVFPSWDMCSVLFGSLILSYVYNEGKSNYFKGFMLLSAYFLVVGVYFFEPSERGGNILAAN